MKAEGSKNDGILLWDEEERVAELFACRKCGKESSTKDYGKMWTQGNIVKVCDVCQKKMSDEVNREIDEMIESSVKNFVLPVAHRVDGLAILEENGREILYMANGGHILLRDSWFPGACVIARITGFAIEEGKLWVTFEDEGEAEMELCAVLEDAKPGVEAWIIEAMKIVNHGNVGKMTTYPDCGKKTEESLQEKE